jgi:hypothetical protein
MEANPGGLAADFKVYFDQLPKDELKVGFFRSIHTYTFLMRHCLCSLEMEREGEGRGECHLSHWIVTINNNSFPAEIREGGRRKEHTRCRDG